jgi:hypothetical protein
LAFPYYDYLQDELSIVKVSSARGVAPTALRKAAARLPQSKEDARLPGKTTGDPDKVGINARRERPALSLNLKAAALKQTHPWETPKKTYKKSA